MLDVYVVVLLAATVRFGPLASVQRRAGPARLRRGGGADDARHLQLRSAADLARSAPATTEPARCRTTRLTRRARRPAEPGGPAPAPPRSCRSRASSGAALERLAGLAGAGRRGRDRRVAARAHRLSGRPADRHRVRLGRRRRGRQDRRPLQGSGGRQGRVGRRCATTASASSSACGSTARRPASPSRTPRSGWSGRASASAASPASARCSRAPTSAPMPACRRKARGEFKGLEAPPFVLRGEPGAIFVLRSDDLGSLDVGSPVFYRRTRVGRVVGYTLDADARRAGGAGLHRGAVPEAGHAADAASGTRAASTSRSTPAA